MRTALLLSAALLAIPAADAADYKLDPQHTSVVFAISHFDLAYVYGMFGEYSGEFTADPDAPADAEFAFTIQADSLDTKVDKRDEHLRSPDFFNVKQFPEITFKSTSVKPSDDGKTWNVAGNLTLHGQTKEVVLPLKLMGTGKGPQGKERIGFTGGMTIKRSEYGMTAWVPDVGDEVKLMISFEGIKQ